MTPDCTEADRPPHDSERATLWVAGGPYHWHSTGGVLQLHKGYGHDDPSRPVMEAREAYRAWLSR